MTDTPNDTIALVGDLMLHTRLARLRTSQDTGFDAAIAVIQDCVCAVANLEVPLSRRGSKMLKHSTLRSDPEIIDDVRSMGFKAVTLANNHMMDYGPQALLDTLDACDRAGLLHCGAGATLGAAMEPMRLKVAGRSVLLVNIASTIPVGSEATETTPGIAPLRISFSLEVDTNLINEQPGTMPIVHTWTRIEDQETVCALVQQLADQFDAVIVSIHWGVPEYWSSPYQGQLAQYQQPLGHSLIDAGASLVFGHHSHSLHGIEVYRGSPIFYSVGNFIFERPRDFMQPESIIVQLCFGERLSTRVVPLWIDDRGLPNKASGREADQVISKLRKLSTPFDTALEPDGDGIEVIVS